jgi:predicted nucleotidyltransferase
VAALVQRMPLRHVLVFGSFARGDMHEFSDVDLLLVGDFSAPPILRERAVREVAWELRLETPIEVIACTPAELECARDRPFFAHVLAEAVEIPLVAVAPPRDERPPPSAAGGER